MKQKVIVIGIIILLVLIAGGFTYLRYQKDRVVYKPYEDTQNKVSFEKPEAWAATSTDGYVRVSENSADGSEPNILVKIEYPASIIPALGLDKSEQVSIAGKNMIRADNEYEVPAVEGRPATKATYTHLLWSAPDGRKIIFEISPWQKPAINPSIMKFLETFEPL